MKNFTNKILSTVILLTVICFAVKAQTNVSGGIYSNATWTKANSPYIVTDSVVVFTGITLTIEPGVIVKFYDHQALIISSATLIAEGTPVDSITFTSNSNSPIPGIWNGVIFNNDTLVSLNYCNIFYGETNGSSANTTKIKNSTFNFNGGIGLSIEESLNYNATIDSCVFKFNGSGLFAVGMETISNCYASNNNAMSGPFSGIGLEVDGDRTINNCISDSNTIGIDGDPRSIINCICNNNSQAGITMKIDGEVVQNCTANSNGTGISFNNGPGDCTVTNCQIEYNGTGIADSMFSSGFNKITMSLIENNYIGLKLENSTDTIFCNKICNNSFYDLYYDIGSGSNTTMTENYWCSTDSATIASYIYDGYDNINLGLVSFVPFDTVGCYLTGCDIHLSANVTNATCDTCHNGQTTAIVSYGHPNYTYTWYTSPIQSTQTAYGLASGTYSVCVTDGNGCSACTSIFVDSTNCTGFAITANGSNETCLLCDDGKAWVNVSNGTAPYKYSWYTSPLQNTDTAYNLSQGTYSVCVTDLYGCAACDSLTIGTGACSAHFELYPDTLALHQYIAVNMASGAGTLTYDWNWGDGSPDDYTPYPSHEYATAGFYTICLTITDTAGCTNTYCNSFYLMRTTNTMIHVTVIAPVVTGVNEISSSTSLYIFPNPASDNLTLLLPENISKGSFKIFNLLGELESSSILAKQETEIDVSQLSGGIYILEVAYGDIIKRQKFIKE